MSDLVLFLTRTYSHLSQRRSKHQIPVYLIKRNTLTVIFSYNFSSQASLLFFKIYQILTRGFPFIFRSPKRPLIGGAEVLIIESQPLPDHTPDFPATYWTDEIIEVNPNTILLIKKSTHNMLALFLRFNSCLKVPMKSRMVALLSFPSIIYH